MADANEELAKSICDALRAEQLIDEKNVPELSMAILSAKMKAEDWYSIVERSLPATRGGGGNGN